MNYLQRGAPTPKAEVLRDLYSVLMQCPGLRDLERAMLYIQILLHEFLQQNPIPEALLCSGNNMRPEPLRAQLNALAAAGLIAWQKADVTYTDRGGEVVEDTVWHTLQTSVRDITFYYLSNYEPAFGPQAAPAYQKEHIPSGLRASVFLRDGGRCVQCGSTTNLHCDHIVPESLGGPTVDWNLQTLCQTCNLKKGANLTEGAFVANGR